MRGKHVHFFKDQSAHSPEEPVFFLAPAYCMAQGQDPVPATINGFVKKVMKADVEPTTKNKVQIWATPQGHFDLYYRSGDASIIFDYPYEKLAIPVEKANEWNRDRATLTHAVVDKAGKVTLEAMISVRGGLTDGYIERFYDQLVREKKAFDDFCARK
jgi:Putative bacterial sensory transduction regulator